MKVENQKTLTFAQKTSDPILRRAYRLVRKLQNDLFHGEDHDEIDRAQRNIGAAEHVVRRRKRAVRGQDPLQVDDDAS